MINVIFNKTDQEILERRKEVWDRYCKLLRWGRRYPVRFIEEILGNELMDYQKYIVDSTWTARVAVWLMSRSSGKSYLAAPYLQARTILIPGCKAYIMAPAGNQSQETFMKIEDLALGNIATAAGTSKVFIQELLKSPGSNGFTHAKSGFECTLYNGSSITSLNSVAKNIVGIRSGVNFYDEAGKIEKDFFALTEPFTVLDTDFITGRGINTELYPHQLQNQRIYASSAEGVDSYLYQMYKECFHQMMLGNRNYFCIDLNCENSLHPTKAGEPMRALVSQSTIDEAFRTNPFKARREYYNLFDAQDNENSLVSRLTLDKYSEAYMPRFHREEGDLIVGAYDSSTRRDNSEVAWARIWKDPELGWRGQLLGMRNLITIKNGNKIIMQIPEQIDMVKRDLLSFNAGADDYENIQAFYIDAGAGGAGQVIAEYLLPDWKSPDGRMHRGLIDTDDKYMANYAGDYPGAWDGLTLFNFSSKKTELYNTCKEILNRGLLTFPKSLNARGEMEFVSYNDNGEALTKYVKPTTEESVALIQMDLAKEELAAMTSFKGTNGSERFDLDPAKKKDGLNDDKADVIAMICYEIGRLRALDALTIEQPKANYESLANSMRHGGRRDSRFGNPGANPFASPRGGRFS